MEGASHHKEQSKDATRLWAHVAGPTQQQVQSDPAVVAALCVSASCRCQDHHARHQACFGRKCLSRGACRQSLILVCAECHEQGICYTDCCVLDAAPVCSCVSQRLWSSSCLTSAALVTQQPQEPACCPSPSSSGGHYASSTGESGVRNNIRILA
jgi:hypothetical protein